MTPAQTNDSSARDANPKAPRALVRFAWGVLVYNLAVIAWGAFVRASGSGAGCGKHWPLCNGEVIVRPKSIETIIEATHRATSGIALISVVALAIWTFRALPKGTRARRGAAMTVGFMFGEALLGAGLVLFELVGVDKSLKRAFSMILHLGNTFLLIGTLALTCWWLTTSPPPRDRSSAQKSSESVARGGPKLVKIALVSALCSVLVLGSSGAIAALGDTLFPASSLRAGLSQDLSPVAHVFLRLRLLHPVIALGTGALVLSAASLARAKSSSPVVRRLSFAVTTLFVVQFGAGLTNLLLLAPIWMQLTHLLLADAMWIALVLLTWESVYGRGVLERADLTVQSEGSFVSDGKASASPAISASAMSASPARSASRSG